MFFEARLRSRLQVPQCLHETLVNRRYPLAEGGFWDFQSGHERSRADTGRTISHDVTLTPDGEYAFVTLEKIGSEPGTVEGYHVEAGERVGTVDVGRQAGGGVTFWKTEG